MKTFLKSIAKYFFCMLIMVGAGYFLLVVAYLLPIDKLQGHIGESIKSFETEGSYPYLIYGKEYTKLDNYTDALMLLNAGAPKVENAWKDALNVNRLTSADSDPVKVLTSYYTNKEGNSYTIVAYGRYWHGYLVLLKPLLLVFNYQEIRCILIFAYMVAICAIFYLMGKRKINNVCPLLVTLFFLNPVVCSMSLQFTSMFILVLIEIIIILLFEEYYKNNFQLWLSHFFIVGILTAYFDLLTFPLVTLGIPLIFLISQYANEGKSSIKMLFKSSLLWVLGYGGMWASKWILGMVITGNDIVGSAIATAEKRTAFSFEANNNVIELRVFDVIVRDIGVNRLALGIACIVIAVYALKIFKRKNLNIKYSILAIGCIGVMPFIWYGVLSNHSYVHAFFTHRELAIFVYAIMTIGAIASENESIKVTKNQ